MRGIVRMMRRWTVVGTSFVAMSALAAPPRDTTCSLTFEATEKVLRTTHRSITLIRRSLDDEAPATKETIFLDGKTYLHHSDGLWSRGPSVEDLIKAFHKKKIKDFNHLQCSYIRDEQIDGKLTALYLTHEKRDQTQDDTYLWILKDEKLIVRSETEIKVGAGRPLRLSIKNEFEDVKTPNL